VLITGIVATLISSQGLRSEVFNQLESVATLKDSQVQTWLESLQTNLNLVFVNPDSLAAAATLVSTPSSEDANPNRVRADLVEYNQRSGYFTEIFVMDLNGRVVVSTNQEQEGKILKTLSFFHNGLIGPSITPPSYELSLQNYSIVVSQPLTNRYGRVIGVLAGRANLNTLNEIMNQRAGLGETGETYVVNSNNAVLTSLRFEEITLGQTYINTQGVTTVVQQKSNGSGIYENYRDVNTVGIYHWIPELQIAVMSEQAESEALATANQLIQVTLGLIVITILAAVLAAYLITQSITSPISKLAQAAQEISSGNLNQSVDIVQEDEIGVLAGSFNNMTAQLRELIGNLEQRVTERTQALTSVAEISTAAATYTNEQEMLESVVHLTQRRFGLYHAHVFVFDEANNKLNIVACGWKEGDEHEGTHGTTAIPLEQEQSLVARAARTKQAVIVNDVRSDAGWLPNPLLPDTASEMAVPLIVGEKVLGVLDVQSDQLNAFTQADANVQTTLANQVASALQNARSFTEIRESQNLLSEALRISRLANWEYDVEHDLFTFNDDFYSIFRTTAEKVGGYRISSAEYAKNFVHPDDAPLVGVEIQKALQSKELHFKAELEHRIIFEDGRIGYISVKINVDRDKNGKIIRWYGANQDITERRQLEELNRKRAAQAEALNAITQKIQSATKIETALQIAARELGHALGRKQTVVALENELSKSDLPLKTETKQG